MTCRLARRLLASTLSATLVLLSPGLETPRLFAQVIGRAATVEGVRPMTGLPMAAPNAAPMSMAAPALMAPTISAPSSFLAAPSAAPAAAPTAATPAAALAETARAIAPQLEAVSKSETGSDSSRGAGQTIIDVLTGAKSAGTGASADVAGVEGAGAPALSARLAASAPKESGKTAVPAAAAPAASMTVDTRASYGLRRFLLKSVAALTGAVYSLPSAGPAITAKLIAQAADKRVVLSDYDDTLASYNQVLPQELVEAVQAVRAAGKDFVVISDRGDEPRPHQLSVFESLASLPVETRAGMYVAANSGGRVYRYDEKGEPVRLFEVPALDEAAKAHVASAAESTKTRLKEIGAEQHQADGKNPAESWGTYGYALMLKVGSSEAQVRGAAAILDEELAKNGLKVEVNPRFAKDPANPPYINFSIVTKEASAGYIARALKAESKDVLVIGDSMYAPHEAKKALWLTRLAARVSGRDLPKTGNATDRNMEKAVPGALTLGVGTTGDPRASNLWVLDGKGPEVTRRVLMSVASKPRGAAKSRMISEGTVSAVTIAALVAAAAAGYYAMFHAFADLVSQGEQLLRENGRDFMDGMMALGGVVGSLGWSRRDDKASRYAALEAEYVAKLAQTPGVVDVKVHDSYHYYGGKINNIVGKWIEVVFDGVASLQKAQESGLLPKTLPAIDGIRDVKNYDVTPFVAKRWLSPGVKAFLIWLAGASVVVAIYGAFFYAATHGAAAPSGAELPEGVLGPIDIGRIFGGFLGITALGAQSGGRAMKVTDERVRAAAASAIMSKGLPWSHTEYSMGYSMALESLKKDGATDAQIELFKKLCAEAPIKGGRFNPWSGD